MKRTLRVGRRNVSDGDLLTMLCGKVYPCDRRSYLVIGRAITDGRQWGKVRVATSAFYEMLIAKPLVADRVTPRKRRGSMVFRREARSA